MVSNGEFFYLIATVLLLTFVIYALITRVLHILFSKPRGNENPYAETHKSNKVNPVQTVSQFLLFGMVIYICFSQPEFLQDTINSIIQNLPK
jgi:hypothetical protein